tara:strand:- start:340 stop:585 length:246 start_codon:yes stop_codon:yes gene_type:complete
MKYDGFKESNFIKIENSKLSNFIEFKYGIEQINNGKNIHALYIRKFIKTVYNNIFYIKVSNVNYKNTNKISSIYSKDWWNL